MSASIVKNCVCTFIPFTLFFPPHNFFSKNLVLQAFESFLVGFYTVYREMSRKCSSGSRGTDKSGMQVSTLQLMFGVEKGSPRTFWRLSVRVLMIWWRCLISPVRLSDTFSQHPQCETAGWGHLFSEQLCLTDSGVLWAWQRREVSHSSPLIGLQLALCWLF